MAFPFIKREKSSAKPEKSSGTTLQLKETEASHPPADGEKKEKAVPSGSGLFALRKGDARKFSVNDAQVLVRPIISEKTLMLGATQSQYVFEVASASNKVDIKKSFFNIYGLMPVDVRVSWYGGLTKRFGRVRGTTKRWKKAVVKLKKGDKIEGF